MESSIDNTQEESNYIGSLIHEGFYDKLIIIGFPYDLGATRCGVKRGQDYGPDSFRRFVKDIGAIMNPEYGVNISEGLTKISDYGNIQIDPVQHGSPPTMKDLYAKLSQKVKACISRGNIPFVLGGTRDLSAAINQSIESIDKKCLHIMLRKSLDLKGIPQKETTQEPELSQRNVLRCILENDKCKSGQNKVVIIGPNLVSSEEQKLFKELHPHGEIVTAEELRSVEIEQGQEWQLGQVLSKIIEQNPEFDQICLSISLEAIEGVTGVSSPCVKGVTTEEIIELCFKAGSQWSKLVSVDLSDYNPFIEDWSTGRLAATIFYYFALGLSIKTQFQQQIQ